MFWRVASQVPACVLALASAVSEACAHVLPMIGSRRGHAGIHRRNQEACRGVSGSMHAVQGSDLGRVAAETSCTACKQVHAADAGQTAQHSIHSTAGVCSEPSCMRAGCCCTPTSEVRACSWAGRCCTTSTALWDTLCASASTSCVNAASSLFQSVCCTLRTTSVVVCCTADCTALATLHRPPKLARPRASALLQTQAVKGSFKQYQLRWCCCGKQSS